MKILNYYILKQFVRPFFYALIAFTGIILIANIFEYLKILLKNKVPFLMAFQYFALLAPGISVQIIPIAVLLGVIFCLNQLNKNRELMIMKAVGINISKIIAPLLCASILISLLVFALNDLFVPACNQKVNFLRLTKIEKSGIRLIYENLSFKYGNQFFYIKVYNSRKKEMSSIQVIEQRLDKTVSTRLDASLGMWGKRNNEYEWVLFDGIIRHFNPSGEIQSIEKFQKLELLLKYSPEDFKEINPEEMGFFAFLNYVTSLKESGYYSRDMFVEFYHKISFPFASFFITLAGIPFALRLKRSGMAAGFGISIAISFIYWVSMSLGLAWGKAGTLPASFAPFLPNFICLMLGTYLLQKTHT